MKRNRDESAVDIHRAQRVGRRLYALRRPARERARVTCIVTKPDQRGKVIVE